MGEVYRADDLRLGQAVALKFLPSGLGDDPRRLALFREEVRLARQVSHPNVCRVYDLGEADGQPFLAMEFVDGEDLAGLLNRIGRLPADKGVHIAHELCAGLAAAHERGVIHRDLKPANVMIDGRGHVRIMDFGLARATGKLEGADARAGTPAYMAPEQRAGKEVTARSDLYALGLVLYEVFTGKRPFPAKSAAQRARLQAESAPAAPSSLVSELSPAVEHVILRCLEHEPQNRPISARAVAAALPGGDPLAAAAAAGKTPWPDMVAAAGDRGGLSAAVAGTCLAAVAVGLLASCWLAQRALLVNHAPLELAPEALLAEAKKLIRRAGYVEPPVQAARGFQDEPDDLRLLTRATVPGGGIDRWDLLKSGHWPGLRFWYRQSPRPMVTTSYFSSAWEPRGMTRINADEPPWNVPGMVGLRLDPRGKLRWFRAVPPAQRAAPTTAESQALPLPKAGDSGGAADRTDLPWSMWFREEEIGFKLTSPSEKGQNPKRLSDEELQQADWFRTPPDFADYLAGWKGIWPDSDEPLYVEAAAYRGKPVYFEVLRPSSSEAEPTATAPSRQSQSGFALYLLFVVAIFVGAATLAWRNLRQGRGDRRGAFRLSLFVFATQMLVWALLASHAGSFLEWSLFIVGLAQALEAAVTLWLLYIALEPFVRRFWPEALISWARLLSGRLQDPRVGRDVLVGTLCGVFGSILVQLNTVVPVWLGLPSELYLSPLTPLSLLGSSALLAAMLDLQRGVLWWGFFAVMQIVLFQRLLRSQRLAAVAFVIAMTWIFCTLLGGRLALSWLLVGIHNTLFVWLLVRFGLLASIADGLVLALLGLPITSDTSAFYFSNGVLVMGIAFALGLYGCYTSLGRQPVPHGGLPDA